MARKLDAHDVRFNVNGIMVKKFLAIVLLCIASGSFARGALTVFTAASTTDVMNRLAEAYAEKGGTDIRFNFASSGTLARQIEAGAPADIFVSAHPKWMDRLEGKGLIRSDTRFNLAANRLVLAARPGSGVRFDGQIESRLAVGDFRSVPAGMYAEEALEYMGWLEALRPKLVMASNVRTALLYAERGETDAAIVYATDVKASGRLETVGTFPAESHRPILYPAAAVSEKESALRFLEFLRSDKAVDILEQYGFTEPKKISNEDR